MHDRQGVPALFDPLYHVEPFFGTPKNNIKSNHAIAISSNKGKEIKIKKIKVNSGPPLSLFKGV
jgi:hypothetical protein